MILNRFHAGNCTERINMHGSNTIAISVRMLSVAIAWKSAVCKEKKLALRAKEKGMLQTARLTWLMHLAGAFHCHGVGMEHRRANAKMDPTAHAIITPINAWFVRRYRRDVIRFLKRSPSEILLKAIVTIRRICAAYSYCVPN